MFVAKRKNGELFMLTKEKKRSVLKELRKNETFYCPGCGQKLILKLGDKRIFHFSHQKGSHCIYTSEPETEYHLLGKLQLYEWLKSQHVRPILESYEKEIQLRPDILFVYKQRKYVIEFQCSPVNDKDFNKRTRKYLENGYIPIWILGAKQLQRLSARVFSISHFQRLFLTEPSNKRWILRSYCPEVMQFITLQSVTSLTARRMLVTLSLSPLHKTTIATFLLKPNVLFGDIPKIIDEWWGRMKSYKINYPLQKAPYKNALLQTLYALQIPPSLLPSEVGLPVPSAVIFSTSPFVWQAFLFIDLLFGKKQGSIIYLRDALERVKKRIKDKHVCAVKGHFFKRSTEYDAIREYFQLLVSLDFLVQLDTDVFKLNCDYTLEQLKQRRENEGTFFRRNRERLIEGYMNCIKQ